MHRTVFEFPAELLLEIFSYFGDHRQFLRETCGNVWHSVDLGQKQVERSTIIRNLTMTCRALRNSLLPLLWKDTEGCAVYSYSHDDYTYGLYAQCVYLLSNPTIAAHVQYV